MSSAGTPGGGFALGKDYFCFQCNRTVTLLLSPTREVACPICHGGFLEEVNIPSPVPFIDFGSSALPVLFAAGGGLNLRNPGGLAALFGPGPDPPISNSPSADPNPNPNPNPNPVPAPVDPHTFFQDYLRNLGDNIQLVLEDGSVEGGVASVFGAGRSIGDYFVGPGLEQLIEQLAENDPNRHGTPPAAKSAIHSLPDIKISKELLVKSDEDQCAVCKDTFEIGGQVKHMPCEHFYHKDCIVPWLELHNSCPVCRYELPTDDPDYEQGRMGGSQTTGRMVVAGDFGSSGGSAASVPADGNTSGPTSVERSFRISLQLPFVSSEQQAEAHNTGDASDNDTSQGSKDANSNS